MILRKCALAACVPQTRSPPEAPPEYTRSSSPQTFIDACNAPGSHRTLVSADQAFSAEGLPFSFRFFGASQTLLVLTVNGMLSFSSAVATVADANASLPLVSIPNTIFAFWDDLQTNSAGLCVATVGTAPNRQVVVEWRDSGFGGATPAGAHLDFEVVLTETTHTIDVLYRRMDDATDRATGASATIGLQGTDASSFDLVGFNTAGTVRAGSALRWTPRGGTICRPSTGVCDPEEVCTGASGACPTDTFLTAGTSCGTGLVCAGSHAACCPSGRSPSVEVCNNVDDDCNGIVDDGVTRDCYSGATGTAGVGVCRVGLQSCTAGAWGLCAGEVTPRAEVCDRLDNNCNGTADEGIMCP